jgi:uncharacterized protein (DUF849 family)
MIANNKVILTCAVTGSAPLHPCYPFKYPVTPRQICLALREAAAAGAAVAHIHVRGPQTGEASRDINLFKETVARIRDAGRDIVINLTAGMGATSCRITTTKARACPRVMWPASPSGSSTRRNAFGRWRRWIENISRLGNLVAGLRQRGWSQDELRKVLGANWLRVYERVWGA